MLTASRSTVSSVAGCANVKLPWFNVPCVNRKKNPVLELPLPLPSSLYKNARLLPIEGGSSYILSPPLNVVDTISKFIDLPSTVLLNAYTGTSVFAL